MIVVWLQKWICSRCSEHEQNWLAKTAMFYFWSIHSLYNQGYHILGIYSWQTLVTSPHRFLPRGDPTADTCRRSKVPQQCRHLLRSFGGSTNQTTSNQPTDPTQPNPTQPIKTTSNPPTPIKTIRLLQKATPVLLPEAPGLFGSGGQCGGLLGGASGASV